MMQLHLHFYLFELVSFPWIFFTDDGKPSTRALSNQFLQMFISISKLSMLKRDHRFVQISVILKIIFVSIWDYLIPKICQATKHYEKSCPLEPHCFTTTISKQLIYNYTTTKAWKYGQSINKMTCKKIKIYIIIANGTFI
jgi:hypothetical protein